MKCNAWLKNLDRKKIMSLLGVLGLCIGTIALIGCPIKYVTGISCPSCGMTRAWYSVFQGDMQKAVYFHPLFFWVRYC